jgi:hypothetical protein
LVADKETVNDHDSPNNQKTQQGKKFINYERTVSVIGEAVYDVQAGKKRQKRQNNKGLDFDLYVYVNLGHNFRE